ncbi:MAG: beta-N-acetylhexosaminidase [Phycisphaeraceae bacterium]|nr:beta-N-acetylhexosaminidase [Phycisphaeraceae bacterium]
MQQHTDTVSVDAELTRRAAGLLCVGFEGATLDDTTASLLRQGAAGVILFSRNFVDRQQLAALCNDILEAADHHVIIAVDHEGGRVQRFKGAGFTDLPAARTLTDATAAFEAAATAARELRHVGVNLNFAPVLDVDSNPANPIMGDRSFGSDPAHVASLGTSFVRGLQRHGVAACGKHFPGHGDTSLDSHLDLPRVSHDRARLEAVEWPPFRAAIAAGVAAIMTAHVVYDAIDPGVPATMSRVLLEGTLRGEMGYEGVIVSDDLDMKAISDHYEAGEAAVRAIEAGVDLILCCRNPAHRDAAHQAIAQAIASGRLSNDRVEASLARIRNLARQFG